MLQEGGHWELRGVACSTSASIRIVFFCRATFLDCDFAISLALLEQNCGMVEYLCVLRRLRMLPYFSSWEGQRQAMDGTWETYIMEFSSPWQ